MVLAAAVGLGARALPFLGRGLLTIGKHALPLIGLGVGAAIGGKGISYGIEEVGTSLFGKDVGEGVKDIDTKTTGTEYTTPTGETYLIISSPTGTPSGTTSDTGLLGGLFPKIGKSLDVILPLVVLAVGAFILIQLVKK